MHPTLLYAYLKPHMPLLEWLQIQKDEEVRLKRIYHDVAHTMDSRPYPLSAQKIADRAKEISLNRAIYFSKP